MTDLPASADPNAQHSVTSRAFCRQFVGLVAAGLSCAALLNFVVNPFAQYPSHWFAPAVQISHIKKVDLLREAAPVPEGLILGSSRVMKIEPDYLAKRTDLNFFNAGVNYALPEDHLAILRWYGERTGAFPRMVVVGIDITSFSDETQTDPRLLNHPELVRQIPEYIGWTDRWHRWIDLLSWQQTRESVRSLAFQMRHRELPEPDDVYRSDGVLVYRTRESQLAEGTYDFESPLQFNCHEYEARCRGFRRLSARRCDIFDEFARACESQQVRLVVFLTPMHPRLQDYLARRTEYEERRQELVRFLTQRAETGQFAFFDASDIASFGGDAAHFVDGIHPLEPNTRKLVDTLVKLRPGPAQYVVQ